MFINRDFRRMLLATAVSDTGSGIHSALITIWIVGTLLQGDDSAPVVTSVVSSIALGTGVLANAAAGVLVDRWNKWRTMLCSDLIMAAAVLVILLVSATHSVIDQPWAVIVIVAVASAVISGVGPFFTSARFVITNDIVPEKAYGRAFGYMHNAETAGQLIGPPLASVIIASLGAYIGFGIDAATFLFSMLLVMLVWRRNRQYGHSQVKPKQDRNFRAEYIEGFTAIRNNSRALIMLSALSIVGIGGSMFLRVEIFFLQDDAGLSANWYGISMGVFAAGLLLGAWIGGRLVDYLDPVKMLVLTMAFYGLLIIVFPYFSSLLLLLFIKLALGSLAAMLDVSVGPLIMRTMPKEILGRVIAAFRTVSALGWMFGTMTAGLLAGPVLSGVQFDIYGLDVGRFQIIFGVAGLLCCGTALVTSVASSKHDQNAREYAK
ncbi:MAG TPA: MFS transporter [Candidatus Stackebrandtia faecavium]|nr:MFS transporter [Candidatus Stackebrandtia faecavium]